MLRRAKLWLTVLTFSLMFAPTVQAQYFEHSYAIVIGINKYQSAHWAKLGYAVKDGQTIAAYLKNQGYDQIITLYDEQATKQAILSAMQNSLAPRLTTKDRVLVFFAGHGFTETLGGKNRGYIVPFDAGTQSVTFISMEELINQSSYMGDAHHQLFIMDSCFGGLLADTTRGTKIPKSPEYFDQVTKRVARQVLTAGGKDQEVQDSGPNGHSVFVHYLIEALQDGLADLDGDGYITFDELSAYLIPRASNAYQTPASGVLPGHGAGEYWFKVSRANVDARAPQGQAKMIPGQNRGGPIAEAATRDSKEGALVTGQPNPDQSENMIAGMVQTNPKDGLAYVWIPPGSFEMGCLPSDSDCNDDEKPLHAVTITKGFWLGQTPVTQAAYQQIAAYQRSMGNNNPSLIRGPQLPVETVSWNQATAYCKAVGMRLPTEAEWEYAARAVSKTPRYGELDSIAWYFENSEHRTHDVAQKQPNAWKLYDMLGNVWEWVDDWYNADYYLKSPTQDPKGPGYGNGRVRKGGSYMDAAGPGIPRNLLRSSARAAGSIGAAVYPNVGFRCAGEMLP